MTGDTFFLGSIYGNRRWSKWLELLQLMVQLGEVELEGKVPNLSYLLAEHSSSYSCGENAK